MVITMSDMWEVYNLVHGYLENEPLLTVLLRLWFIASLVGFMSGFVLAYLKRMILTSAR